ncbi:hypothetical protein Q1695_001960 [Nippostrongylus brasiliensis]|nr:hypothetical protein Q1695_001960 [Nippostrongylus brasiliensis]
MCFTQPTRRIIKVGLLFVENVTYLDNYIGYRTSASAVLIARDRILKENLLPGYDFEFIVKYDQCQEMQAAGAVISYSEFDNVDVILGPTCNRPTIVAALIANYYNKPLFTWGLSTSSEFNDAGRFPALAVMSVNANSLALAIQETLMNFDWNQFAFVFSSKNDVDVCSTLKNDLQTVVAQTTGMSINYIGEIVDMNTESCLRVLKNVAARARIVIACFAEGLGYKRNFLLAAKDGGYFTEEFVYILAAPNSRGFSKRSADNTPIPIWVDTNSTSDGRDQEAFELFRRIALFSNHDGNSSNEAYQNFTDEVIERMKDPPFRCFECVTNNSKASQYAGQLYDSFYLYAKALNATLSQNASAISDGVAILNHIQQSFEGVSGPINMSSYGTRNPTFYLTTLDSRGDSRSVATIHLKNDKPVYTPLYKDESSLWFMTNGFRPQAVPKCGFLGKQCPPGLEHYAVYIAIAGVLVFLTVAGCVGSIIYAFLHKRAETARLNQLWQIPYVSLKAVEKKEKATSFRSLRSSTNSIGEVDGPVETRNYIFYVHESELVAGRKHKIRAVLNNYDASFFRKVRQLDNDNLNRFIGICLDGPQTMSLWKRCSRGSINDVLTKGSMSMDYFFIFCLLRDIVEGLNFIHNSVIDHHGFLTSKCCLVDDRWQVKISDFGVNKLRVADEKNHYDQLWTAPEILRSSDGTTSKEGDIYSFGIICAQVITRSAPWDLDNRKETPEEIIYMVKKGGHQAPRPPLDSGDTEIDPSLLHLVRDCWAERGSERPPINIVKSSMKSMRTNKSMNLMDHVFNMLESYASTLEDEVAERTKELIEEKKKSDILLYRMLPRQVADKLKLGQSVEPEMYTSATVFFSDVVSFTTISAKGSPLQVVNLLNSLYTTFDSIIDEHDVYKVETIGDAYLCVSGIPNRNGNEHIKEICSMSLGFIRSLDGFVIPHLPREKLNVRIGVHTGSVVAGVVGLSMPRYCLFGDTVNTASRMESNGKPGLIHLSADANSLLQEVGGYETECRGEVIIKGKGVMETYWLLGASGSDLTAVQRATLESPVPDPTADTTPFRDMQLRFEMFKVCQTQLAGRIIQVGMMFVENVTHLDSYVGFRTSASAVLIAADRIYKEQLLPGYKYEFQFKFDQCDEIKAAGATIAYLVHDNVDVLLGPTCNNPTIAAAIIANYYNKPLFTWGFTTSSEFSDAVRFPSLVDMSVSGYSLARALRAVLMNFDWYEFAFLYLAAGAVDSCNTMKNDLQSVVGQTPDMTINYVGELLDMSSESVQSVLQNVATRARIVITCFPEGLGYKRRFILAALDGGYLSNEYFYIMTSPNARGFTKRAPNGTSVPNWVDMQQPGDGRDEEAFKAFQKIAMFSSNDVEGSVAFQNFSDEVIRRMREAPFNCTDCGTVAAQYAGQLYDSFYLYARALNATLSVNSSAIDNGKELLKHIEISFDGASGRVVMGSNGTRNPVFYLGMLTEKGESMNLATVSVDEDNATYTPFYKDEASLWYTRNGVRPPAVPKCGFTGLQCPRDWKDYLVYIIVAGVLIIVTLIGVLIGIIYAVRNKRAETARLNQLWQIPYTSLTIISKKEKAVSFNSLSTANSVDTKDAPTETRNYIFFLHEREVVAARKHKIRATLTSDDASFFRKMRQMENDNLNRFIGICLDGPQTMSLWKRCSRGSINDVLTKGSMTMDSFFAFCLLRDIVEGLNFIHNSVIDHHGFLTSKCCVVDDRWQVKISDFGVNKLRVADERTHRDLLWTAPEILRSSDGTTSKEGDIYSFAIICAEVIMRSSPWDLDNRKESAEEIIYMVKKGGHKALRPPLDSAAEDTNPSLLYLVRDCWAERGSERPPINVVKSSLESIDTNKSASLMDHVFNMMESYASTLEGEVAERSKELIEEKKKGDILLYRMLPRQIADKLKLGQSVDPEVYDSATVYYSDVVSFTTISAKGSPLQVVNLLNSLYSTFDSIIDEHDVYKVETIGDAYLCVSGIPNRNGNEHIKEICSMSLEIMKSLEGFVIPHLPREKLKIRIGLHTGPVVAGVVGLSMPKYCLFGDTVNTASKMESNGKPGMIHLTADANKLLQQVGGYVTESRGEVIIKEKGVMETYWLLGAVGSDLAHAKAQKSECASAIPETAYTDFQLS